MPAKRSVLDQLTRDELVAVVSAFDLAVEDRRLKQKLVDAVAASKKAPLEAILGDLSRERLKEICRALGVDDSGREKQALVERLAGNGANGAPSSRRNGGGTSRETEQAEVQPGETLTLDKLERHLWSAADPAARSSRRSTNSRRSRSPAAAARRARTPNIRRSRSRRTSSSCPTRRTARSTGASRRTCARRSRTRRSSASPARRSTRRIARRSRPSGRTSTRTRSSRPSRTARRCPSSTSRACRSSASSARRSTRSSNAKHQTEKEERKRLIDRFLKPSDPLSILVVCDMLLTGFDAPIEQVMYLDSPLEEHTLLQAIARVNRVYDDTKK